MVGACKSPSPAPTLPSAVATLPNSWTILVSGEKVFGLAPDGLPHWTTSMPQQDQIATPITAAADGTVYLRGRATLHALSPSGDWLWRSKVPGLPAGLRPQDVVIYAPIAMSDSTAAVMTDGQELMAFSRDGKVRWRRSVDGTVVIPPRCASNGEVIVLTTVGLFAVSPAGSIDWHADPEP